MDPTCSTVNYHQHLQSEVTDEGAEITIDPVSIDQFTCRYKTLIVYWSHEENTPTVKWTSHIVFPLHVSTCRLHDPQCSWRRGAATTVCSAHGSLTLTALFWLEWHHLMTSSASEQELNTWKHSLTAARCLAASPASLLTELKPTQRSMPRQTLHMWSSDRSTEVVLFHLPAAPNTEGA